MIRRISLIALLVVVGAAYSWACTNFLVTKGASVDGSTMITYAADSHTLYGELYYQPAADHPEGTTRDIYEWDTGNISWNYSRSASYLQCDWQHE